MEKLDYYISMAASLLMVVAIVYALCIRYTPERARAIDDAYARENFLAAFKFQYPFLFWMLLALPLSSFFSLLREYVTFLSIIAEILATYIKYALFVYSVRMVKYSLGQPPSSKKVSRILAVVILTPLIATIAADKTDHDNAVKIFYFTMNALLLIVLFWGCAYGLYRAGFKTAKS